jgi:serine protease Do
MRRPTTLLLPALLLLGGIGATLTTPATAAAQKKTEKSQSKTEKTDKTTDDRDDDRRGWRVLRAFGDGTFERGDRAVIGVSTASFAGKRDTLGVLVESVTSDGPAEKAGIEEGDRIAAINGTSLRLAAEDAGEPDVSGLMTRRLTREMGKVKAGDEVTLSLWKGGQQKTVRVKTVAADSLYRLMRTASRVDRDMDADEVRAARRDRAVLGLNVTTSGSRRDTLGALVTAVATDGPAEKAGIVEGDRIASINGVDLRTASEDAGDRWASGVKLNRFYREMRKVKAGQPVELRVVTGGQARTVRVTAGKAGDVYKDQDRYGFFGGEDGGDFTFPAIAPMPPMPAMPPMAALGFDGNVMVNVPRIAAEARARARASLQELDIDRDGDVVRLRTAPTPRVRVLRDGDGGREFEFSNGPRARGRMNMSVSGEGGTLALPGLRLTRVTGDLASYFGKESDGGLLVTSVAGADWDGLREGDVIVKVNGDPVASGSRSRFEMDTREKNELEVIRKGKRAKVTLDGR